MVLKQLPQPFTVCKIADISQLPSLTYPIFLAVTEEEISLVCPTEKVPPSTLQREDGWLALKIEGVLDFGLVGILAKISSLLAAEQISIFAISTFNTDYILIKKEQAPLATKTLRKLQVQVGHPVVDSAPS